MVEIGEQDARSSPASFATSFEESTMWNLRTGFITVALSSLLFLSCVCAPDPTETDLQDVSVVPIPPGAPAGMISSMKANEALPALTPVPGNQSPLPVPAAAAVASPVAPASTAEPQSSFVPAPGPMPESVVVMLPPVEPLTPVQVQPATSVLPPETSVPSPRTDLPVLTPQPPVAPSSEPAAVQPATVFNLQPEMPKSPVMIPSMPEYPPSAATASSASGTAFVQTEPPVPPVLPDLSTPVPPAPEWPAPTALPDLSPLPAPVAPAASAVPAKEPAPELSGFAGSLTPEVAATREQVPTTPPPQGIRPSSGNSLAPDGSRNFLGGVFYLESQPSGESASAIPGAILPVPAPKAVAATPAVPATSQSTPAGSSYSPSVKPAEQTPFVPRPAAPAPVAPVPAAPAMSVPVQSAPAYTPPVISAPPAPAPAAPVQMPEQRQQVFIGPSYAPQPEAVFPGPPAYIPYSGIETPALPVPPPVVQVLPAPAPVSTPVVQIRETPPAVVPPVPVPAPEPKVEAPKPEPPAPAPASAVAFEMSVTPQPFSPDGDGKNDKLVFRPIITEPARVSEWRLLVKSGRVTAPAAGLEFKEWKGTGEPPYSFSWDGRGSAGPLIDPATEYSWVFWLKDKSGREASMSGPIAVDLLLVREGNKLRLKVPSIVFGPNRADFQGLGYADLTSNAAIIARVAAILAKYPDHTIVVEGHGNNEGKMLGRSAAKIADEEAREVLPLTRSRAAFVRSLLAVQGLAPSRMTAAGMGSSTPMWDPRDSYHAAANRRVEFVLVPR